MIRCALLFILWISVHLVSAQTAVETSATTTDVKVNEDKKVRGVGRDDRVREKKGKSIPTDRPAPKNHKSLSKTGVFRKHNHFSKNSNSAKPRARDKKKYKITPR